MKKIFFFIVIYFIFPLTARAGFLDNLSCMRFGNCGLNDIALGFTLLIQLMLGGMGAVALVYFVYGGFQWVISSGNTERVKKGKDMMVNTVFAIIVAFGGFLILDFFINNVLNVKQPYQVVAESCRGKSQFERCGPAGSNYVCTGIVSDDPNETVYNETCVPRCFLVGLQTPGFSYSCIPKSQISIDADNNIQDHPGAFVVEGSSSWCPSGYICVGLSE